MRLVLKVGGSLVLKVGGRLVLKIGGRWNWLLAFAASAAHSTVDFSAHFDFR